MDRNEREKWLRNRHKGITATEASIIMGRSIYANRDKLVAEKASPFVYTEAKPWFEVRHENEPDAVSSVTDWLVNRINGGVIAKVITQMSVCASRKPVGVKRKIIATLDAYILIRVPVHPIRYIVEVKCVDKVSSGTGIPPCYIHQVIHQLACCDFDAEAIYAEYSVKEKKLVKVVEIGSDEARQLKKTVWRDMVNAYREFERDVAAFKPVEELEQDVSEGAKDKVRELSKELSKLMDKHDEVKKAFDEIDGQVDAIKKKIAFYLGKRECHIMCDDFEISQSKRIGSIEISRIPINIPLDSIRKPCSYTLKIKKNPTKMVGGKMVLGCACEESS